LVTATICSVLLSRGKCITARIYHAVAVVAQSFSWKLCSGIAKWGSAPRVAGLTR
jgi:hypothetical protein